MSSRKFNEDERRTIASIFFTIHDKLSLEEIREKLGKRIGKSTISRDKKGLRNRETPSQASAEAYAAALGYSDGIDTGDPDVFGAVISSALEERRNYFDRQPLFRHFTSATHKYPKVMSRIIRSLDERRWDNVIDLIATFREGDLSDAYGSVARYLEFYLGLAYRNLGDPGEALKHFKAAYELTPENTNEERDFLSHAAANYALALQDGARPLPKPEVLDHLLLVAVDTMPTDYPENLVNVLVVASRMPDGFFGISAERVAAKLRHFTNADDIERIRATFLAQIELQDLHEDDMFKHVIAAADERLAFLKGA
ncbi:tetratricopeptide repeat protein [Sedimentitalea sp. JM2-8]|uniref:Tetratricopeptide repeat protein n=1 Tax=Sedimentitalea xiamensis TaxID=3050037 RepID=A0ABT7FLL6_9RHOB|nr:tetratricopeptide repeat protein [Sedimentitalea xiamensis]MDK3075900.1 tetratricopeptide repeat protein [Sedimentitalea xiamensis]